MPTLQERTAREAFRMAYETANALPVLVGLIEALVMLLYGLHKRIAALEPEPAEWPAPPDFAELHKRMTGDEAKRT